MKQKNPPIAHITLDDFQCRKPIPIGDIKTAYVGSLNDCFCGCAGTYHYPDTPADIQKIAKRFQRAADKNPNDVDVDVRYGILTIQTSKGGNGIVLHLKPQGSPGDPTAKFIN